MPVEPADLALAADFVRPTREQWRGLVAGVLAKSGAHLKDDDPEVALSHVTYDSIVVRPLYTADDAPSGPHEIPGQAPFTRGALGGTQATTTGWDVRARHLDPDPLRTNAAVLDDLERGATSLWLVLGPGGLPVDELEAALKDVYLDLAPIALDAGPRTAAAAAVLARLADARGVGAELRGTVGADPIGARARLGCEADPDLLAVLVAHRSSYGRMRLATVDGSVCADAGASDAQELGIGTAIGVAYLRQLTDAGLGIDEALDAIEFRWTVTAEQFPSIAKLRAARRVWDRVAQLSGAGADRRGQYQHAVTSAAVLTRRDPWANLLRTTIGCFSAAVGGADAITVLPFDAAIGLPDGLARRIARNTSAILHDESSLARVVDPAGGSWYVESLTDALAERAWDVFTGVERAGGALAALDSGALNAMIAGTREQRGEDIAHRRMPITGVSEFAFPAEVPVERPPFPAAPAGGLLPSMRYAQDFETLRDRSDAHLGLTGRRPGVFLAALGPVAAHSARVAFATNLFQAGGLEVILGAGPDVASGWRDSGAVVACLCSSDQVYADSAADTVAALREAGAGQVWVAGRFSGAGADRLVYAGCDALAVLGSVLEATGVAP